VSKNRIFRDELPDERKSIVNLLMTGYLVAITCMGYIAFYLYIQLGQMDRITEVLNVSVMTDEQFSLVKDRMLKATHQMRKEVMWLVIVGNLVSIVGAVYMFNLVVRPLRQLVKHIEEGTTPPEIKSNNEIKQLLSAINRQTENSVPEKRD
tara:strand:+ start:1684 stop:2136 length:453 start_codon:yes stop_codon:yes gene_type:complete